MPATYSPEEVEYKQGEDEQDDQGGGGGDHGGGRRPPTDKRTGGGGDPENWDQRARAANPRERIQRFRMGLLFALMAVLMFFAVLVSVFFVAQANGHISGVDANARFINDWLPTEIPPILFLNTALLLISSLTIEAARRHMFKETDVMDEWLGLGKPTVKRALPWLLVTIFFGCLFLVGQWMAWSQLTAHRATMASSASAHSFYLITGAHALHLVAGVALLGGALWGLLRSRVIENRQILVDLAAWYWHSMGVLWLALFALLKFAQ